MQEIENQIKTIVADVIDVNVAEVTKESAIGDFPAWDSMGQLVILQRVEETYCIKFEPEEMMEIEDVNDIIKTVEAKL